MFVREVNDMTERARLWTLAVAAYRATVFKTETVRVIGCK